VCLGDGETIYLTQEQCLDIAYKLQELAADIGENSFQKSTFSTYSIKKEVSP
jgi:hypothetical protein